MFRLFKFLGILAMVALFCLVGVGAYVRSQLNPESLRQLVSAKAGEQLGRTVSVGQLRISWSGEIRIDDLKILKSNGQQPQVSVKTVEISLALVSLLSGGKELSRITLSEPIIDLNRNADGTTDVQDVVSRFTGKKVGASATAHNGSPGAGSRDVGPASAVAGLGIPRLEIVRGQVQVLDAAGAKSHHVKDLDLSLSPRGPDACVIRGEAQYNQMPFKFSGTYNSDGKRLHIESLEGRAAAYDFKAGPGDLSFANNAPSLSRTALILNGNPGAVLVALSSGGQLQGAMELRDVDLSRLRKDLSGKADLNVTLSGTISSPSIGGTIMLRKVRAQIPNMSPEYVLSIPEGELVLENDIVTSKAVRAELMGLQAQPTFRLSQLRTKARIELQSGVIRVDLASLMSLAPKAQREKLQALSPTGSVSVEIKIHGDLENPLIAGGLTWSDVSVNVPKTKERVEIKKGRLEFLGDRIDVKPTSVVFRGSTLWLVGLVTNVLKEAQVQLRVAGKGISSEPFLDFLPPDSRKMEPRLVADLDVRISKTKDSLDLNGTVSPRAGSIKLGSGKTTKKLKFLGGGSIAFSGKTIQVESLPLQVDQTRLIVSAAVSLTPDVIDVSSYSVEMGGGAFKGSGKVRLKTEGDPTFEGFQAHGSMDLAAIDTGAKVSGSVELDLSASGPGSDVKVEGKARSSGLGFAAGVGGLLRITNVSADIKGTPGDIEIPLFSGKVCGGDVTGNARVRQGSDPSYEVRLKNISLDQVRSSMGSDAKMVDGRLSATFQGKGSGPTLTGAGRVTIKGLSVDMSENPQVQKGRQSLGGGAGGAGLLAKFGGDRLKSFAKERQAELEYYATVIEELSKPQPLGDLEAPIKVTNGVVTVDPIKNEKIEGRVVENLNTTALSGNIAVMVLGDVTLREVGLGGTTAAPFPRVNLTKLTLKGKAPPAGISNISAAVSGMGGSGDIQKEVRRKAEKSVGDFLKKEAKKGKLGALGTLLEDGGEESSSSSAAGAAATVDGEETQTTSAAKKAKPKKKLLDELLGGQQEDRSKDTGSEDGDAAKPAPSPSSKKKQSPEKILQKKLLKSLFGGDN